MKPSVEAKSLNKTIIGILEQGLGRSPTIVLGELYAGFAFDPQPPLAGPLLERFSIHFIG